METRLAQFLADKLGAGFLVPDYALLYTVATLLGLYLAVRKAGSAGLDPLAVFKAGAITVGAAFVSARLFVVLQNFGYYLENPVEALFFGQGGTASSGGYIGGFTAAIVAGWWQRLPLARFFDCCAPSAALAISIGRVGCFMHGCCYGKPSTLPWAVSFPSGSEPHYQQLLDGLIAPNQLSLPLHPTQLYEAVFAFALFLFLLRYRRRQRRDGELVALLFVLYPLGRFLNEFLRDDYRGSFLSISVPQWVSLVAIAVSEYFLIRRFARSGPAHGAEPGMDRLAPGSGVSAAHSNPHGEGLIEPAFGEPASRSSEFNL